MQHPSIPDICACSNSNQAHGALDRDMEFVLGPIVKVMARELER